MQDVIVGIDLGGTYIKAALITRDKEILAKDSRPTQAADGPEVVLDIMKTSVEDLLESHGVAKDKVLGVGIGSPGPLNWQTGIIYQTPNLPGWENYPIVKSLEERVGMKCYLENDANAACYGEYWLGAGQGTQTICVLTLGTGVGGGVVVFGRLLRGLDGTAAELGHINVQRDGRLCGCGAKGCLEAYASVTGMVRTAAEGIENGRKSMLTDMCGDDLSKLTGKMISDAVEKGDEFAKWVMEETGTWLGIAIADLINTFNPEKIVLCGGMIAAGDALFDPIRRTARELAFDVPAERAQILPAGLGGDAGVIGAAGCALERIDMAS